MISVLLYKNNGLTSYITSYLFRQSSFNFIELAKNATGHLREAKKTLPKNLTIPDK